MPRVRVASALLLALAAGLPLRVGALEAGSPAPEIAAPALDRSGATLRLSSFRGKVVYVDFWASWCVPCRQSMPALDSLYRRHGTRGFVVLGVNKDMSPEDAQRFLGRVAVSFPLVDDTGDRAARAFEVAAMPSGYLIDRRGIVRYVHRGFATGAVAALERRIDDLLKEPS
jgi:thiol-disulfide isomerase/thioredoxin